MKVKSNRTKRPTAQANRAEQIAVLNDRMRQDPHHIGELRLDMRIATKDERFLVELFDALAAYNEWYPGSDPRGHRDFGMFRVRGITVLFQMQYRDRQDPRKEAEEPWDEAGTVRVLRVEVWE
jgi:Protein of unknown function (DUF3768)